MEAAMLAAEAPQAAASKGQSVVELVHKRQERTFTGLAAQAFAANQTVDCEQYPMFCDPKINCAGKPLS
eukprot:16447264-Heterocapsa_arctica.AAC.1